VKLHRIEVENINSLYGKQALDLDSDLGDAPLFLVVGPTGAGKSTLLDAVCLALFGATPRLRKPKSTKRADPDDARRVMSHGTASARATVVFSKVEDGDRTRYRATWSCHRSRGKPTGSLQTPRRSLERWDPAEERWDLIVDGSLIKEYREHFATVLEHMDLGEFRRAILLAQGEFAAFLRASEDHRAAILERLTGTGRYRKIGERASRARAEAEKRVAAVDAELGALRALDPAARGALEAEARRQADQQARAEATARALTEREAWLASFAGHDRRTEQLGEQSESLGRRREEHEPDALRLTEHARCAEAGRLLAEWRRSDAERTVANEQLRRAGLAAKEALSAAARATGRAEAAAGSLTAAEVELDGAGPVIRRTRELRGRLARARELSSRHDELRRERRRLARRAVAIEQQRQRAEEASGAHGRSLDALRSAQDRFALLLDGSAGPADARARLAARVAALDARIAAVDGAAARLGPAGGPPADEPTIDEVVRIEAHGAAEERSLADAIGDDLELQATLRWALDLAASRDRLVAGEACPLCGAVEHGREFEERDRRAREQAEVIDGRLARAADQLSLRRRCLGRARDLLRTRSHELALAAAGLERKRGVVEAAEVAMTEAARALQEDKAEQDEATEALNEAEGALKTDVDSFAEHERDLVVEEPGVDGLVAALRTEAESALGGRDPDEEEARLAGQVRTARAAVDAAGRAASEAAQATASAAAKAEAAREALDRASQAVGAWRRELDEELVRIEVADLAALEELVLPPPVLSALRAAERALELASGRHQGALEEHRVGGRAIEEERPEEVAPGAESQATAALQAILPVLRARADELRQSAARLAAELDRDDALRRDAVEVTARLARERRSAAVWQRLHRLIGVGDGDAFKRFAQVLNLAELIADANVHLGRLGDRYQLCPAVDDEGHRKLSFAVIDSWQGGERRPITTLSGGETFLVSLALALALGQARSARMPIETLLLDEGFGTLDVESQDVAMAALDRLRACGTQVGIISHVESLRERIPAQILVEPLGDGRSRLRVQA
jgi:DNA repair protein SbcC/Rad50